MDHAAIVRDYQALRSASILLHTDLAAMLTPNEIAAAASALGMLHGKEIVLKTDDESSVLMDFAIHDIVRDGESAVDRLLRENPPPEGSDKMRLLRSTQQSHYTIFDVQTPIPGVGVRDWMGLSEGQSCSSIWGSAIPRFPAWRWRRGFFRRGKGAGSRPARRCR